MPRRFLHPAGVPGQEGPLSDSVGVVSHGFRLPGRGRIPFRDTLCTQPGSSFCKFCLLPDGRWAICPCAPYAVPSGKSGGAGHAAKVAPETGGTPTVEQPFMVRRFGAWSLAYRPGCPGRTGSGMTRERPGKSGFSGREQKKHCLLLRLGIWTFDCVREVAAWGR